MSEKARLAQSVERLALNQVVVGSSPTVGASFALLYLNTNIIKLFFT
jgi:plasmid replication initiation protein